MAVVIHRDGTFTYRGDVYQVGVADPGDGFDVFRVRDSAGVGTFGYLSDLRELLRQAEAEGWPDLIEPDVPAY